MSKSFSREAKTHTHRTEQLEIGKKKCFGGEGGGGTYIPLRSCCVCTHTHPPPRIADSLVRLGPVASCLPSQTHTHTQDLPSVCLVSTSCRHPWKQLGTERIGSDRERNPILLFGAGRLKVCWRGASVVQWWITYTPLQVLGGVFFSFSLISSGSRKERICFCGRERERMFCFDPARLLDS